MSNKTIAKFPLYKLFPNLVTLLGLCSGLTSIKYTFQSMWEFALIFIVIAAILDGLDGKIARFLDSESDLGANLDSLSDFLSFGVAPAFLLYFWSLKSIKVFGWMIVMIFVVCMVIRLARFNVMQKQGWKSDIFFLGIPAPIGAILILNPVIMKFSEMDLLIKISSLFTNEVLCVYLLILSFLIVSKIPTFSAKNFSIPKYLDSLALLLVGMLIVFFLTKPWILISLISIVYLISIPFSIFIFYYYANNKN